MIIYSVTVKIDHSIREDWLKWMKERHIPDVMATGLFIEYRLSRVMVDQDDGVNYSIQYLCENEEKLRKYNDDHAPALQREHTERYKDKFVAFRTLLKVEDHNSNIG